MIGLHCPGDAPAHEVALFRLGADAVDQFVVGVQISPGAFHHGHERRVHAIELPLSASG